MTFEIALVKSAERDTLKDIILYCNSKIEAYERGERKRFDLYLNEMEDNKLDPKAYDLISTCVSKEWAFQEVIHYCEDKINAIDRYREKEN